MAARDRLSTDDVGADDPLHKLLGTALADGRYVLSGVLGQGSQGATLEAVDKREGRAVAIKRFQIRGARSWKDVELAEREARVLTALDHPLLPRAIEHFEEDGSLCLVMDKVEGPTLTQLGTLSADEVLAFLHDADEVLRYLHGRSPAVIHRDIKPGNVIRRPPRTGESRARYVLVDFGSVRDNLKPAGGSTVVGTFGYMAPEQFQGRARPASDVYAAGVTALRMLTGVEPEDLPHRGLAIDVQASLGKGTPKRLVHTLERMLDPDPDTRASAIGPLLPPEGGQPSQAPPAQARRRSKPAAAKDAAKDAAKAAAKAATATRREARARRKKDRKRARAQRRAVAAERPMNANDWGRGGWPFIPRLVALLGMSIAQLVLRLVLGSAVPLLLTLLSLLFGASLRTAAKEVRKSGMQAREAIQDVKRYVRGQSRPPARVPPARPATPRVRVHDAEPEAQPRVRVADSVEDAAAEAELAAEESWQDMRDELRSWRDKRPRS